MNLKLIFVAPGLVVLALFSCKRINAPAPERTLLDSTLVAPVSELSIPVFYPVQELEDMANEKLAAKIIEANLALSEGNDSLFLSISRFKPLTLDYDGDRGITYKLPVQIDGHIDSKVAGIRIRNKTPIRAKIIITLFSDLYMKEDWNLATKTELKKIEWVEEPKIKIAGINFNLKPSIEKMLEKNQDKIIAKLDQSAGDLIKVRQSVEKLWGDIQKPIRINRKVVPVWLKGDAVDMNGTILKRSRDTLMIEVSLYAKLRTVFDSAAAATNPAPLPPFVRKESNNPGLTAYAHITLPFATLNSVISQVTDTMKFVYGKHIVKIRKSEVYGTDEGIAIHLATAGDVKADLYLRGTLGYNSAERKLVITNFGFDINSEQSLVNAANWFVHDEIVDRIKPYLTVSLENAFSVIPDLITKGVEKGKLGRKIDIHFSEFDLNIHQHLVTRDNIQIIAVAHGQANVGLQKALFNKKKKPV